MRILPEECMDIAAKLLHRDKLIELIVGDRPGQQPADLFPEGVLVSSPATLRLKMHKCCAQYLPEEV